MKKGKYLVLGLFPIAISAFFLKNNTVEAGTLPLNVPLDNFGDVEDFSSALVDQGNGAPLDNDIVEQLVLANAETREVIGILERLTGRTALIEQKLPNNKISIDIHDPISRMEAISAVESVLMLNGIAVVDMGDKFIKLVSLKSSITQSPDIVDQSLQSFEPTQRVCSKFFKLNYLDAGEFQKTIKSVLTPSTSNIIHFMSSNALFITDTMANLQNVENLLQRTDMPIKMIESVNFIPLNNVKASAVVKKFDQLKRGALKKYLSAITIDCDDTSNQLIVITPPDNFEIIQNIAKQLDNKCELLLKSEVIRIKHGDAKKITDVVAGIIKEQRSRIEKENKMAFERQQAQMTAQGNLANALAQAASGARSNQQISNTYSDFISSQQVPNGSENEQSAQFSANLTLASDERSNSIIIYGTSSDLAQVKNLIAKLDILLDQVRIEVIVAQVRLSEGQQSGIDAFNFAFNQAADTAVGKDSGIKIKQGSHELAFEAGLKNGSSFSGTLKNFALNSIFKQAKTDSNIKILSTPSVVTTHNRKAQFKIGEERPFTDSSTKGDTIDSKERVSITYKHVGLELVVTPLIGSNGIIQMEIEQKVSKYDTDVAVGNVTAPVISDKQVNSFVSVANGDVVVLAGFKEKQSSKNGGKTFLLGDLPIIGDLFFSSKDRKEETTELIIFIKPTIILHPQDEAAYLDKRLEITNFKNDIEQYKSSGTFPASEPFPKDTLFGLNGQEMKKKLQQEKLEKQKKLLAKKQDLLDEPSTETEQDKFEDKQHHAADENPTTQNELADVDPSTETKQDKFEDKQHRAADKNPIAQKKPKIAIENKLADTDSPTEVKRYGSRRKRRLAAAETKATEVNTDSPTEVKRYGFRRKRRLAAAETKATEVNTDSPTEVKRYGSRRKRRLAATEAKATEVNTDSPTEVKRYGSRRKRRLAAAETKATKVNTDSPTEVKRYGSRRKRRFAAAETKAIEKASSDQLESSKMRILSEEKPVGRRARRKR
ncbi:MAG: hypothetical protein LBH08_03095 [Puniceicoccales bacterium]|nr:hypothetical protein [Puniceicoccales bacterium]